MQLDWTTFILEILNFLVLVWILQRFLYRPVLDLLAARQQKIAEETEGAHKLFADAEALRAQYESRLADWQQECEGKRCELHEQLTLLKQQELGKLKQALVDEEEKTRVRNQTLLTAREGELLRAVAGRAYAEAGLMLARLASAELTRRIAEVFVEDLAALPDNERMQLRNAAAALKEKDSIEIVSAHPLASETRDALVAALHAAGGNTALQAKFSEDAALIAGLRAIVGECELRANLSDELEFFRRRVDHAQ